MPDIRWFFGPETTADSQGFRRPFASAPTRCSVCRPLPLPAAFCLPPIATARCFLPVAPSSPLALLCLPRIAPTRCFLPPAHCYHRCSLPAAPSTSRGSVLMSFCALLAARCCRRKDTARSPVSAPTLLTLPLKRLLLWNSRRPGAHCRGARIPILSPP
ncbi:hypothetical protein E2C01_019658 [Portunus trituberculatus]|uniref:Uncharacterized protein n=1 Tax=Portunus trituberculatus TaxID=210409 RepID=A0A5B7DZJ9_PORTR|nr:hypothetical protein [Portunus trituberculatus]